MNLIHGLKTRLLWAVVMLATPVLAAGCSQPIYHGLDEKAANEMVVTLEQHGLQAGKERDPVADDAWMVTVPSATKVNAWQVLQAEGLPRPKVEGFSAYYPSAGLVPSSSEERVLLQYSTAQELRKSLMAVDSVVEVKVNLVLPEKPRVQLETTVIEPPRASVLIKYRADKEKPPMTIEQVRDIVAGGVEGLDGKNVRVIFTRSEQTTQAVVQPALATVGPVSVAAKSKGIFQGLVVAMGVCIVLLTGGLAFLVFRMRRAPAPGGANS